MNNNPTPTYGELCSLFYDATEQYASDQEVDFFATFIKQHPGKVLEAMSGSGRLQIPLMQRGYTIDGVDRSYAMLERCKQRCAKLNLTPNLYQQSLESLQLPESYNTVIIAVGSLQLISDRAQMIQALKNLHAHMVTGGNILIDIFVPDITINASSVSTARLDINKVVWLKKQHVFDVANKVVDTFCLYELIIDHVIQKQETELITIAWYSDDEWQALLLEAGFKIVQIYDQACKTFERSRIIHAQSIKNVTSFLTNP